MVKKRKWKILSIIAMILIASLAGTSWWSREKMVVNAAITRMYGIQQIINRMDADDPLVILEVVPDEAYASLGYYVRGFEPAIATKLLEDSIHKTGSSDSETDKTTRTNKIEKYYGGVGAPAGNENATLYPFCYGEDFYQEQLYQPENMEGWQVIAASDGVTFEETRTGYYRLASEYGLESGDYHLEITLTEPDANEDGTSEDEVSTEVGEDETAENEATENTETAEDETAEDADIEGADEVEIVTTVTFAPGEGEYVWVDDASGSEQRVEFDTLYYKTQTTSNNWFSQYVLETDNSNFITVISLTASELDGKLKNGELELNEVDLVYFSNTSCLNLDDTEAEFDTYETAGSAVSWETAYLFYEYVVNTDLAVIMDASIIDSESASIENNNIYRLAYLLMAYTEDTTLDTYSLTDESETWTTEIKNSLVSAIQNNAMGESGSVAASVYVNASGKNIVNTTIKSECIYDSFEPTGAIDQKISGMSQIVSEIISENFYNGINQSGFTTEYEPENQIKVTQAAVVKYVMNYRYRRIALYKDKITVLDIEPTKYSTLTEEQIRSWLGDTEASKKIKEINIVQTTTSEFIGKLVDLNESYDLIYFGSCIGSGNTEGSMNQKDGEVVYNDSSMKGLIYTHIGDSVTAPKKFAGLLDSDYIEYWDGVYGLKGETFSTRYSGNDITREKMEDLMEFVDAGYPVILSSRFCKKDISGEECINEEYVDNSSYLYQFMDAYISKTNVMNDGSINQTALNKYINMPKLYLSMISVPTEYSVVYTDADQTKISNVSYLEKTNGKYYLKYSFEFSDSSESLTDTTAYKVQLYIDTNADGQFAVTEELDGLAVEESNTGEAVAVDQLQTGVRYTVVRELPSDYVGILPWQLKVSMVTEEGEESSVRATQSGYTAIRAKDTKINVLQITGTTFHSKSYGQYIDLDLTENSMFQSLFADMKEYMGYDIQITSKTVDGYVKDYNNYAGNGRKTVAEFYKYYFEQYDMIILGFSDCYDDISSDDAMEAIQMFIESGKSVLFSHDTTSYVNADKTAFEQVESPNDYGKPCYWYWGYHMNQYTRTLVGMDRYGITESESAFKNSKGNFLKKKIALNFLDSSKDSENQKADITALNKDFAYKAKSKGTTTDTAVQGFSDFTLNMNKVNSNEYTSIYYRNTEHVVNSITQVNEGQITTYPYNINTGDVAQAAREKSGSYYMQNLKKLTVASTHGQYYQLDMQLDKNQDGNSDMVVWYCLGDSMYDAKPNDVRNNYYIYSVGNVTYTGMGHFNDGYLSSSIGYTEAKLFVNTIIASYNSGKRNPSISIVANEEDKGTSVSYIYRVFDEEMSVIEAADEEIYFYALDSNIINGKKTIQVNYYYEVAQSSDGTVTLAEQEEEVYLNKLGNSEVTGYADVDNNKIYKAVLKSDWINEQMKNSSEVKFYIGVQTKLEYTGTNREDETTDEVFACVTFKRIELFDLD